MILKISNIYRKEKLQKKEMVIIHYTPNLLLRLVLPR
jgi:hypothetical protein